MVFFVPQLFQDTTSQSSNTWQTSELTLSFVAAQNKIDLENECSLSFT